MPGMAAPRCVVERLARFHPRVKLVWNTAHACWQLIELLDNRQWDHIKLLRKMLPPEGGRAAKRRGEACTYIPEAPTLENTVYWLDQMSMPRIMNAYERDRWLEALDERDAAGRKEEAARVARASDLAGEGAERQWRAEGKRIPFVPDPSPPEG